MKRVKYRTQAPQTWKSKLSRANKAGSTILKIKRCIVTVTEKAGRHNGRMGKDIQSLERPDTRALRLLARLLLRADLRRENTQKGVTHRLPSIQIKLLTPRHLAALPTRQGEQEARMPTARK